MWRGSVAWSPLLTIDLGPLVAKDALALAGEPVPRRPSLRASASNERAATRYSSSSCARRRRAGVWPPASLSSLVLARMYRCRTDRAALRAASGRSASAPARAGRELAQLPDFSCDVLMAHFSYCRKRRVYFRARTDQGRRLRVADAGPPAELHRAAAKWYGERDRCSSHEQPRSRRSARGARAYLTPRWRRRPRCSPARSALRSGRRAGQGGRRHRRAQHAARPGCGANPARSAGDRCLFRRARPRPGNRPSAAAHWSESRPAIA